MLHVGNIYLPTISPWNVAIYTCHVGKYTIYLDPMGHVFKTRLDAPCAFRCSRYRAPPISPSSRSKSKNTTPAGPVSVSGKRELTVGFPCWGLIKSFFLRGEQKFPMGFLRITGRTLQAKKRCFRILWAMGFRSSSICKKSKKHLP